MCGVCGCGEDNKNRRLIEIEKDILHVNNSIAKQNRAYFNGHKIIAINLLSSPGSGKTTLLEKTLSQLSVKHQFAVIEGDQHTDRDAERIRILGTPVQQINTGKLCHLEAEMIQRTLTSMELTNNSILFIENVGNLVCPALFDLGETHKVVLLSVTEGDDKPIKYPDMFHAADLMIINKMDLLPYVDFSMERCVEYAKRINSAIEIIKLSATEEKGMDTWHQWLMNKSNNCNHV